MTNPPTPLRVCHVITRLDVGGAQETAVRTCIGLRRRGHEVRLVSGGDPGFGGSSAERARAADVEVEVVDSLHGSVGVADVKAIMALRRSLRRWSPDVVHTHSGKAGALGRLAAFSLGIPAVHTVHGWSFNDFQRPPVRVGVQLIERVLARTCRALVVVTDVDRRTGEAIGIGRGSYRLIRSGIDFDALRPVDAAVRAHRLRWGSDVVVSVGRLGAQKDPITLVRAFATMRERLGRGRLVVVGDGPLRHAVLEEIRRSGMEQHVELLGIREDVGAIVAAGDVFALASRWEGLPRSVIEAMALGTAVVATDVGGTSEVVRDEVSGLLVPPSDPAALSRSMERCLTDDALRDGLVEAARAIVEPFSEQEMVAATEALYRNVLGAGGRT